MPGDPVEAYLQKFNTGGSGALFAPGTWQHLYNVFSKAFGLNIPLWDQYYHFWDGLLHGNMGVSIWDFPAPVTHLIKDAAPYTLALLVPAIVLSYVLGNRAGALAARRKALDNTVLPVGYIFQAAPYPWLALALAFLLAAVARWFPISGGYNPGLVPAFDWTFIWSAVQHWFLPFLTIFLVSFGGWAIGMRSLVIYELETDYARYLRSLGATQRLVRKYAYRNAVLPQLSGLASPAGRCHRRQHRHRDRVPLPRHRVASFSYADHRAGLFPVAGHIHIHHHRRAPGQFCDRHRLRHR